MTPNARKILGFVLQFPPLFLVCFVIYLLVLPVYQPIVLGTANTITERMSPSSYVRTTENGNWEAFTYDARAGQRRLKGWSPTTIHLVLLSLVSLPALVLATPAPVLSRLKLLGIGLALVFASHVLSVIVMARGVYALQQAPGTFFWLWALRVAYASGQFFAAAFWILLTWRYWFAAGSSAVVASAEKAKT
jgi:hypothetical protein